MKLTRQGPGESLIEPYVFDRGPRYIVLGGLVFQELTRTYLQMYGSSWKTRAPFKLVYADSYPKAYEEKGFEKLVILSRVIPTKTNVGYEGLSHLIVTKVNGVDIKSIADLDGAIAKPIEGFHKIEFEEFPSLIYLDAKEAEQTNGELKKEYGIHELKQIE